MHVTKQRIIDGLSRRPAIRLRDRGTGDASVALLISDCQAPSITLCVKAAHLRTHAGEVSLPGGKQEACDRDSLDAACRELYEETSVQVARTQCLGALDQIHSLHQLRVTPWVLWSDAPVEAVSCEVEIARVFQCPLERLMELPVSFDTSRHRDKAGLWMPRWEYDGEVVWGLTALILANFLDYGLANPVAFPDHPNATP